MRELRQRHTLKRWLYSTPALVTFLILAILLARGAYSVMTKERESAVALTTLRTKVDSLTASQTELEGEIGKLNTGPGIDEAIKEKFNVAAAGEHVAVIITPIAEATATATSTKTWFRRLWDAIIQ